MCSIEQRTYLFLTVLDMDDLSSIIPRNGSIIVLTVVGGSLCLGEQVTVPRAVALGLMALGIALLCFYLNKWNQKLSHVHPE